jgi:hypothetical protein
MKYTRVSLSSALLTAIAGLLRWASLYLTEPKRLDSLSFHNWLMKRGENNNSFLYDTCASLSD